jgi:hypothetical protein
LNPKKTALVLLGIAGLLCLVSFVVWLIPQLFTINLTKLSKLVYVDFERNIPTFFSVVLFLISASVLFFIGLQARSNGVKDHNYWTVLSYIFLFLSLDEFAGFHEKMVKPANDLLKLNKISDFFAYGWVVPAFILVVVLGFIYIRFIWALPKKTRFTIIGAAFLFLFGAIGMEMIGGFLKKNFGMDSVAYVIGTTFEEFFELTGLIVFIYGLLDYLKSQFTEIFVKITPIQKTLPKK